MWYESLIKNMEISKTHQPIRETTVTGCPILLPLKDLFINRELELDYKLDDLKILFATLNLPAPQAYISV